MDWSGSTDPAASAEPGTLQVHTNVHTAINDTVDTHSVRKKRTDSILAVTLTNLDDFSHFLAQIILTIRVTKFVDVTAKILSNTVYLTCSQKLTGSQLTLIYRIKHNIYKK